MAIDQERARVRSYLVSQADKLSVDEIWEKVEASFGELAQSVSGNLTAAQLNFKPSPAEWSIVEVLSHITSTNISTGLKIQSLALGKEPSRADTQRAVTAADDLLAIVTANGEEICCVVQELPASPELEPTAPHMWFGPLNCKAWLLFVRLHNLDHAKQIMKNREHEGFPR